MIHRSSDWIDLGAFEYNMLSIKGNVDDSKASPFVELKDTDASKSGWPPQVNEYIPNLKACCSKTDSMIIRYNDLDIINGSMCVSVRNDVAEVPCTDDRLLCLVWRKTSFCLCNGHQRQWL